MGAILMRALFIIAGVALIETFEWMVVRAPLDAPAVIHFLLVDFLLPIHTLSRDLHLPTILPTVLYPMVP